jgi:hypothetical protein
VRFSIEGELDAGDRDRLRGLGWKQGESKSEYDADEGRQISVKEWFQNQDNGARVLVDLGRVAVEASVPRFCGLDNAHQGDVGQAQARSAFEGMTNDLLPATSERGRFQWHLTRIDLAKNFEANVPLLVGAYGQARHTAVKSAPKVFFGESVSWYGKQREIVLYDKGLEMGDDPGHLARIESRWKGVKGVDQFVRALWAAHGLEPGVPVGQKVELFKTDCKFPVMLKVAASGSWGQSTRLQCFVPYSDGALNKVLRDDVARLGTQRITLYSSLKAIAFDAMLHYAEYMQALWQQPERTRKRWRADLKVYRSQLAEFDLVKLAWPATA